MSTDEVYVIIEKLEKRATGNPQKQQSSKNNNGMEKIKKDSNDQNKGEPEKKTDKDNNNDQDENNQEDSNQNENNQNNNDQENNDQDEKLESEEDKKEKELLDKLEKQLSKNQTDKGEVRDFPGKNGKATEDEIKEQEQEIKISLIQAENQSKQYGIFPGGLKREIQDIIKPKIDPREFLQNFIAMNAKNDFTWSLPERRYLQQKIFLPSLRNEELGNIIVAIDTSGSIDQKEFDNFAAILSEILQNYKVDITVLYCDTKVHTPQYLTQEDLPLKLVAKGWGGTDLSQVFKFVRKEDLDPVCLIYFTDLECDVFPDFVPYYPTIWVSTEPLDSLWISKPPFGEIIFLDTSK